MRGLRVGRLAVAGVLLLASLQACSAGEDSSGAVAGTDVEPEMQISIEEPVTLQKDSGLEAMNDGGAARSGPLPAGRLVVIGVVLEGKLTAVRVEDLIAAARKGSDLVDIAGPSIGVGMPLRIVELSDGRLLVTATDHRDLVLVERDWTSVRTVSLGASLGGGYVGYGDVVPTADQVAVSHDVDGIAGVSTVDLTTGAVSSRSWTDHPAVFPAMCALTETAVAVVSNQVAVVDVQALERRELIEVGEPASGAACLDGTVWIAAAERPALVSVTPGSDHRNELVWDGHGGTNHLTVDADGALWVPDPTERRLVRCIPGSGCERSPLLPSAPGSIQLLDDVVIAANTDPGHLHVLDRGTLELIGSVQMPEGARGLAHIER